VIVKRPASGLVTAVEPVMRACSGTWVAHGSGSADREVVDAHDRVLVPPGLKDYWLRRVWLTAEEEQGYYYGFANEGMWPLCHVAHVRPVFRESDWAAYRAINQRFADAVVAEARSADPVVLVQDYHFALLPAMVREKLPQATILTFWHIPWPNPESFGICPWRREILQGMLGSTILGFHTRYHCKNFIETVDRYLEARIEHEHSTISFQDKDTLVESYPISIEWPGAEEVAAWAPVATCRQRVIDRLQLPADVCLAVGVDRFDYTKGILERLNAVERLLEKWPAWIGRFVFVQVAAPTRSSLDEYRSFQERTERVTARINERFGRPGYQPVHLLAQHHEHDAVMELLRAANICVVTSLHDGMNLVCKEFVAARDDLQGVLILSRFAGAARELSEALIVNPYHVEETADALNRAALMPTGEQRERMASLRSTVSEFNVFRWAGRMLADAGRWRLRARIEARVRSHQPGPVSPAEPAFAEPTHHATPVRPRWRTGAGASLAAKTAAGLRLRRHAGTHRGARRRRAAVRGRVRPAEGPGHARCRWPSSPAAPWPTCARGWALSPVSWWATTVPKTRRTRWRVPRGCSSLKACACGCGARQADLARRGHTVSKTRVFQWPCTTGCRASASRHCADHQILHPKRRSMARVRRQDGGQRHGQTHPTRLRRCMRWWPAVAQDAPCLQATT
jgi:trehalose-6-phosphate synthase